MDPKLKFFEDSIKIVVADFGYTDISVNFNNVSEYGVNYLGVILKVTVSGKKSGKQQKLFFVVKAVPDNQVLRMKFKVDKIFNKEVVVYSKILPVFNELQKKHNVQNPLNQCKVVKTVSEEYKEMMLMYDLTSSEFNFEQSRIGKVLDLQHARSVVTNIGKMHALSFATNKYFPGLLEKNLAPLPDILSDPMVKMITKKSIMVAVEVVLDSIAREKLSEIIPSAVEYITNMLDHKNVEPYAVLVHGDIWSNNIMFKYEGDALVESVLLDWQIVRYHSPIMDLLFFLFTSVEDDARAANFQTLLDLYYSSLSEYLKELDCDPELIFSRDAFDEQLKKFTKFSLINILFMLPVFTGKPFDPTKLDLFGGEMPELTDLYKKRVNATLRDLINNGLF